LSGIREKGSKEEESPGGVILVKMALKTFGECVKYQFLLRQDMMRGGEKVSVLNITQGGEVVMQDLK
jgi:hypothetical protein